MDNRIDRGSILQQLRDGIRLMYSRVAESHDQTDAVANVITFAEDIEAVEIWHGELTPQDFVINGQTIPVAPGGWRSPIDEPYGKTVGIPPGVTCIVSRLV